MKKNNKEPWRIIVFIISVIFIAWLWCKNDIIEIYTTMPQDQIVPMIITTVIVTFVKIVIISGIILVIKWIFDRIEQLFNEK